MYTFRDSKSVGTVNNPLPTEAVSIDGEYIENRLQGFQTLYTSGRESLEKEIEEYDTTKADGSQVNYTRFPAREITVGFQLTSSSAAEFRQRFNKLNQLLNKENVRVIFADEPDKYYTGTPVMSLDIDPGRNNVVGEYTIFCADPFKYSLAKYEANTSIVYDSGEGEPFSTGLTYEEGAIVKRGDYLYECVSDVTTPGPWNSANWSAIKGNAFVVNYDGSYRSYPEFYVGFDPDDESDRGDCGFIQIENNGARIQFGNYEEEKIVTVNRINSKFKTSLGGFTNASTDTKVPSTSFVDKANATYTSNGLTPKYGTLKGSTWHGSYLTAPATAADKFNLTWQQAFMCDSKQAGMFALFLLDASNNVIASVRLKKSSTKSSYGLAEYYIGNELKHETKVKFSKTGVFGRTKDNKKYRLTKNKIIRNEEQLSIQLACDKKPRYFHDVVTPVAKVGIFFGQYGSKPFPNHNELKFMKFTDGDAANSFSSGDELYIDCNSATVTVNERENASLGDVGNEWSDLYLDVGINVVHVAWSDWVVNGYEPNFKLVYQKRWL